MGRSAAQVLLLMALAMGSIAGARAGVVHMSAVNLERQPFSNIAVVKDTINTRSNTMDLLARAPSASPISFNYTLSDMSPMLIYSSGGWESTLTGSTSAHTATTGNSFINFGFVGTGIYIFGQTRDPTDSSSTATASIFQLVVEDSTQQRSATASTDSLLVFKDKLEFGYHTATFSTMSGTISLSNMKVLTQISTEAPNFESVKKVEAVPYDGTDRNTAFVTSGNWYTDTISGNSSAEKLPVLNGRAGASFTYSLPANSSYVVVYGVAQPDASSYTVSVSPDPPSSQPSVNGNANRGFTNPTQFYIAPLDPSVGYNVSFAVGSDTTDHVGVRSIVSYSAVWTNDTTPAPGASSTSGSPPTSTGVNPEPSPSTSSSPSKSGSSSIVGPVVGGVVGGVGGLLLLALAVFLYLRRKKRVPQPRQAPDENFVIDDDVHATPYPYEMTEQEQSRQRLSHFSDASTAPLAGGAPHAREPVQGYIPSPASPSLTATTATTTNMLGLGLVNGDDREMLTTNSRDPAMASYNIASQKRAAAQRAAQEPFHPPQERDAGRWDAAAEDAVAAMKSVPPSYDPSWAGDYSDVLTQAGTVVDDPISAGPSGLRDSLLTNDSGARRDTLHDFPVEELLEEDRKEDSKEDKEDELDKIEATTPVLRFKPVEDNHSNDSDETDHNNVKPKTKP